MSLTALLITPFFALLAAPFVGSFLGVLIRRLPAGRPVAWQRSACEACGHPLGAADLLPIASFLALRGRCRHCRAAIPRFHLLIELAALAAPACCLALGMRDADLVWFGSLLGWSLLALAWIDWTSFLLPDVLTLPLLVGGLAVCLLRSPALLTDRSLAAILGYASLWSVAWIYRRVRHRDGLGGGDAKLFAAGGAWVGLAGLPDVLLGAAVIGLAAAGVAALRGRAVGMATRLAFGPPLALAIWLVWLMQNYG